MKKNFISILLFCVVFSLGGCAIPVQVTNPPAPETPIVNEEETIINMFVSNATYESNGCFYFRKWDMNFLYSFCYNPAYNTYSCGLLETTYVEQVKMSDSGSITFYWKDFKNGVFYGDHQLEYGATVATIKFNYSNITFNNNYTLGSKFSYSVTENTYKNLTDEADIDSYALESFDCIMKAIGYAKSILAIYTDGITLW